MTELTRVQKITLNNVTCRIVLHHTKSSVYKIIKMRSFVEPCNNFLESSVWSWKILHLSPKRSRVPSLCTIPCVWEVWARVWQPFFGIWNEKYRGSSIVACELKEKILKSYSEQSVRFSGWFPLPCDAKLDLIAERWTFIVSHESVGYCQYGFDRDYHWAYKKIPLGGEHASDFRSDFFKKRSYPSFKSDWFRNLIQIQLLNWLATGLEITLDAFLPL